MSKRPPKTIESKIAFSLGELLATVFVVAYLVAFFRVELPNQPATTSEEGPLRRLEVLTLLTVPDAIAGIFQQNLESGWFGERLYLLTMTTGYLLVAAAAGSVLLRWLRPQVADSRVEQWVFALGLGLAALSLETFLLGLFGLLYRWLFLAIAVAIGVAFAIARPGKFALQSDKSTVATEATSGIRPAWLWMLAPLVLLLLSGAMLPPTDFDVLEYHLQAPKEFFQNGHIGFLPHNIYANMPLGAEMHALAMMVVTQDWFAGALIGKTIIACFALLTTAAIYSFSCRFFSRSAGIVAAIVYLSTPWVLLVSSSGLIDCVVGCYTLLAIYALALWRQAAVDGESNIATRRLILCGLMAGAAVSCKYPAVLFLALPIVGFVLAANVMPRDQRSRLCAAGVLIAAMAVPAAPWFIKNWVLTGNPTYPLLYSVFGGKTRTPEKDAQWKRAHAPPNYLLSDFGNRIHSAFLKSDWIEPAMAPLAVAGVAAMIRRRRLDHDRRQSTLVLQLAGYCALVFLLWWLLTHRIDRFLIPIIPIAALLAGNVLVATPSTFTRWLTVAMLGLATAYAVAVGTFLYGLLPGSPQPLAMNWAEPTAGTNLLLVGEAAVFECPFPAMYNTCFDDCLLEQLISGKSPQEAKQALRAANVSYIQVNWGEIERYRSPGNYGYSTFPTQERFRNLVNQGVLEEGNDPTIFRVSN